MFQVAMEERLIGIYAVIDVGVASERALLMYRLIRY